MSRIRISKDRAYFPINDHLHDVMLTITGKGGHDEINIYFRNQCHNRIAHNLEFVVIEIDTDKNRLYFLPGTKITGYKLTRQKNNRTYCFKISKQTPGFVDIFKPFVGTFDMIFDQEEKAYFIDESSKCEEA